MVGDSAGALRTDYDAVVVGASVGGCTAARLLAQHGARVALVERRPALDAYKTVCTHFIQSSAAPVMRRLGLAELIDGRGAVRNSIDLWTPYGGWIRPRGPAPHGYNVTRRTLDPLLRELTADTPGVDLLSGWSLTALLGNGRPAGVEVSGREHQRRRLRARLVVGADGRGSPVARMAGMRGRVRPHNRFFYWSYWSGIASEAGRSRMWMTEPDAAYTFPNEDGLTVVLTAPHRDRLPEWRRDLVGAYERFVTGLPDPPDLSSARRESKLLGKLDVPNVSRPPARPGVALVGDAALASDPLWGVGCGWAFQSAEWLADAAGPALAGGGDVDAALKRYRRRHRRGLGLHHFTIADLATGRPARAPERAFLRAAARDQAVAATFEAVGTRRHSPVRFLSPATMLRVLASGARQPSATAS